jgi:hypothetical protein
MLARFPSPALRSIGKQFTPSSGVAFDLAASFWQVHLPPESAFVMRDAHGAWYRVLVMPFGVDFAPEVMQILVDGLARHAADSLPPHLSVKTWVHIDNILAVGAPQATEAFAKRLVSLAAEYHITLNLEPSNTPSTLLQFVGMVLDFQNKTTRLSEANVNKFLPITTLDSLRLTLTTFEDLERLLGRLFFAQAVLGIHLAHHYFTIKWWRRRLADLAKGRLLWSHTPNIPSNVYSGLLALIVHCASNAPAPVRDLSRRSTYPAVYLATDATLTSWGCVLMRPGYEPTAHGAPFAHPPLDIGEAEALLLSSLSNALPTTYGLVT